MKIIMLFFLILGSFATAVFAQNENKPETTGNAIVYFYSLAATTTLGRVKKPVFLDDMEIAEIRPERYFIVMVEPGKHTFRLKNKKFGGIEMEFEAGKTYYLRIGWSTGDVLKPTGLFKVEPESGGYDIKQLRPVDKGNIKNKEIVFRELPAIQTVD